MESLGLKTSILMLTFVAGLMTGCGRSNTIYSDSKNPAADAVTIDDGPSVLPQGLADQSLGDGVIEAVDSKTPNSRLRFSGTRAILGLTNYDSTPLSDFELEFTTENSKPLTIALLVDLACSSDNSTSVLETLVAVHVNPSALSPNDAIWTTENSRTPFSLSDVLTDSPNACLKNGRSTAAGFPSLPIGSILLLNGEPASASAETIELKTLKTHSDTFTAWGAQ